MFNSFFKPHKEESTSGLQEELSRVQGEQAVTKKTAELLEADIEMDLERLYRSVEILNLLFEIVNDSIAELKKIGSHVIITDYCEVKQRLFKIKLPALQSKFNDELFEIWQKKQTDEQNVLLPDEHQMGFFDTFSQEFEQECEFYVSLFTFESEDELSLLVTKLIQLRDEKNSELLGLLNKKIKLSGQLQSRDTRLDEIQKKLKALLNLYNNFLKASEYGDVTTLEELIKHEKNPSKLKRLFAVKDSQGNTPLHLACLGNHKEAVCLILGCNATDRLVPVNVQNNLGYQPIHSAVKGRGKISRQTDPAVINAKQVIITSLSKEFGFDVDAKGEYRRTALNIAAHDGYYPTVIFLVGLGAQIDSVTVDQRTPLLDAVWQGHKDIAGFLLQKGAKFDDPDFANARGELPIYEAIQCNRPEIFQLLFDVYRKQDEACKDDVTMFVRMQLWARLTIVDDRDPYNIRKNDSEKILAILLNQFKNIAIHEYQYGDTLIHLAARSNSIKCMKILLQSQYQVDPNAWGDGGRTPLHIAAFCGNLEIVQLLLNAGANINLEAQDAIQTTVLQSAVRSHYDNEDIVSSLLLSGADLSIKNSNGESILEEAKALNKLNIVNCLNTFCENSLRLTDPELYEQLITLKSAKPSYKIY